MDYKVIQETEKFVRKLFDAELSKDFVFHDLEHTLSVLEHSQFLGKNSNLNNTDLEILALAALFHDTGYIKRYKGHEKESIKIAKSFLSNLNYPREKLNLVLKCITATEWGATHENLLEAIIKDADLANTGGEDFLHKGEMLRKEWEVLCNEYYSDQEWLIIELNFLTEHQFLSKAAQKHYTSGKEKNIKNLRLLANSENK